MTVSGRCVIRSNSPALAARRNARSVAAGMVMTTSGSSLSRRRGVPVGSAASSRQLAASPVLKLDFRHISLTMRAFLEQLEQGVEDVLDEAQ
ncbi:hypothetical protein SPAR_08281 [Streptomyces sparsogenes DSM 40356]|uniref:Uncharacterized protein n=1 Tax=Streptomyces sparsogenes DSM 40356 TaxID=1331668 RepID=A0A1R1SNR4_9ACTN|nr:hypothetical protein SPAR_08281 [Streptomyces sparsogenes DSM 40356]